MNDDKLAHGTECECAKCEILNGLVEEAEWSSWELELITQGDEDGRKG